MGLKTLIIHHKRKKTRKNKQKIATDRHPMGKKDQGEIGDNHGRTQATKIDEKWTED